MSFSSRRRNYFLTPHRRDGLIEWMKSMLMHSFVLDALATTGGDTFSHFEELVNEHRLICMANNESSGTSSNNNTQQQQQQQESRLKKLVPSVGVFYTSLPLRKAYEAYNAKYRLDKRRHLAISFNEIRHILNLAQIMAMRKHDCEDDNNSDDDIVKRWSLSHPSDSPSLVAIKQEAKIPEFRLDGNESPPPKMTTNNNIDSENNTFNGPSLITFDGDQTLYSDGANFESNPKLASYLYLLLRHGVNVAVVTAAGYEYHTHKYELRLSGLLQFFKEKQLTGDQCNRFYLFGGECNYLLRLGDDYHLHPVREYGAGGWRTSTKYLGLDSPANWPESDITGLLDEAEQSLQTSIQDQNLRARFIRKKRSVGMVPEGGEAPPIPREALDETVLRVQDDLDKLMRTIHPSSSQGKLQTPLPYCAFNGGRDVWVDVGNKRVGVQILQSYLGISAKHTLHIGDQFLNTGNDYAARQTCPCIWITSPDETTYILKSILRLASIVPNMQEEESSATATATLNNNDTTAEQPQHKGSNIVDFAELERRRTNVVKMDVYTGELIQTPAAASTMIPPKQQQQQQQAAAAAGQT